ncbi:MAG: sulfatase-like hydrolase/transferase [Maribacter sp.]
MNVNTQFPRSLMILCIVLIFKIVQAQERPNIIFILTDDQSYGMMGCTGNEVVQTPNIDMLAKDGVLFANAHITSAICTPSRASILTSQFERKHGINFNSGTSMSEEGWNNTYPMVLRDNGYYSGWIGKNHLPVGNGGYASGLMDKSFDYWYAGHGHLGFYPKDRHKIFKNAKDDTQIEIIREGISDFLSNEQKLKGAQKFLDQRPKDKPFVLSVNFNLPHDASASTMAQRDSDDQIYKTLYDDVDLKLPKNYIAKKDITHPKLPAEIHRVEDRQEGYNYVDHPDSLLARYQLRLQAMTGIDRMVGELREKLKAQKLDKNTIIVFTSDHGLFMGEFGIGGKALCYEITTHVPLIIYDPSEKKSNRGRKSNALVQSIDIAPTLLKKAAIDIPDTYQGRDLTPLLSKEKSDVRDYLYTENLWSTQFGNPRCEAVKDKRWKYIRYYKNENFSAKKKIATAKQMGINIAAMLYKVHDLDIALYRSFVEGPLQGEEAVYEELFDLENDPYETTNLAAVKEHTSTLEKLRGVWKEKITFARGDDSPKVLRYTTDSEAERGVIIEPK